MRDTRAVQALCELSDRPTNEIRVTIDGWPTRGKPNKVSEKSAEFCLSLDVLRRSATSLCSDTVCNISLQVMSYEGVAAVSTVHEVYVIGLSGRWHKARKIGGRLSMSSEEACASSLGLFQARVYEVGELDRAVQCHAEPVIIFSEVCI